MSEMRAEDLIGYGVQNLRRRKLRSWLTILGIVLGIATIVILVSIGDGVKSDMGSRMSSFGTDMITITPGGGRGGMWPMGEGGSSEDGKLYEADARIVKGVAGIDEIALSASERADVEFKGKEISTTVTATTANVFEMFPDSYKVSEGRLFGDNEQRVAFIGSEAASSMFGNNKVDVNSRITINGELYRVVGIAQKTGQNDRSIYVPYDDKNLLFADSLAEKEVGQITVKVISGAEPDDVGEKVESALMLSRRVMEDELDFTVTTPGSTAGNAEEVTDTLGTALLMIGMISAVVGAIGISNTMFMSVLERTKEIGVLKSLGATSRQILGLFVAEAAMLGAAGGLLGLAIGVAGTVLVSQMGISLVLTASTMAGSVLFAIAVGVVAGLVPARNASKVPAIEALVYG